MVIHVTKGTESQTGKSEVNQSIAMAASHCHPQDGETHGRSHTAEAQGPEDTRRKQEAGWVSSGSASVMEDMQLPPETIPEAEREGGNALASSFFPPLSLPPARSLLTPEPRECVLEESAPSVIQSRAGQGHTNHPKTSWMHYVP